MASIKGHSNSRRQTSKCRAKRLKAAALFVLAAFVVVFGGVWLALSNYVGKTEEDAICRNVFIGTMDVSGMTKKQAAEALRNQLARDGELAVTLKFREHNIEAFLKEFGFGSPDIDKLVKKAVNYGKSGSVWQRYRQMKKLEKQAYILKESYTVEEEQTVGLLKEKAAPLLQGPEDAYITRGEDGTLNIVDEKEGEAIDEKGMLQKITEYLNGKWKHEAFSLELAVTREKPGLVRADLEEVTDELGSYSTYAGGGQRWTNLKTGVGKLNGIILKPGEELSVYSATAPYDEAHGYVEGTAYENGQVVPSYGGGICQVSTTLYNAAIYAELEIVERYPHSMAVDYVEPSRDAAIAGGVMDFRFKNPYAAPIYIFGEIDASNQLRVVIYGKETRPENRSVQFESETLSTENYGVTYKAVSNRSFGEMAYTGSPHTGREARLWKVVYEGGAEVSRDIFNTSSYTKSDQIVEVGTAGGSAEAVSALEAAIASQDADAINNAIQAGYSSVGGESEEESGGDRDNPEEEAEETPSDTETGTEE